MSTKRLTRAGSMGLLSVLLISAAGAQPPRPDPGDAEGARSKKIETRVKYWVEQIRTAKSNKDIDKARKALRSDYDVAKLDGYAGTYADRASQLGLGLLTKGIARTDPLKRLKETNMALALSRMSRLETQPALEVMVGHSNAAVRYYGWRGYRDMRDQVLGDAKRAETMLKSLDATADESSPAVLGAAFEVLRFPGGRPTSIGQAAYDKIQQRAYALLDKIWLMLCKKILSGDTETAQTCGKALVLLTQVEAAPGALDNKKRQRVRQMVINMTWCAGQSYDRFYRAAKDADKEAKKAAAEARKAAEPVEPEEGPPPKERTIGPDDFPGRLEFPNEPARDKPDDPARAEMPATAPAVDWDARQKEAEETARAHRYDYATIAMLLRTCEAALNAVDKNDVKVESIGDALRNRDDPGTTVREASLGWADRFKDRYGTVVPRRSMFQPKVTTTRAATATTSAAAK